jgi:outer membrane protein
MYLQTEVEAAGARPPRAQFSAPSRKTLSKNQRARIRSRARLPNARRVRQRPWRACSPIFIEWILLGALICLIGSDEICAAGTNTAPTLTLSQAHELALKNHPRLAAANYRVLAAEQVVKETRAGFFPQVNLYGSAVGADSTQTRIMAGGLNNPSVFDRAAEGLGMSQLLTDFGRTANLTASSKFQAQAENQTANATREQVLLNVDANYFGALEAQAVDNVAKQTLDTRQLLLDQVSTLASNKLKSELDVSFARVAVEQARLLEERASNDTDAAMAALSTAMGLHETREFQLVEQAPPIVAETNDVSALIQIALRDRPELASLRDVHESELRFSRAQRDARLPSLEAVGTVGNSLVHDDRLPDNYAAGGIQLSMPLFAGGLYTARQREAELRANADAEMLRAAEDNVVRDVRIAWLNFNNAQERLHTTEQLVQHASEAFDLAKARYKVGSSSIVELSQAQLELTSAQIAETNAHFDVLVQQANLNYQIGAMSSSEQLASNHK